MRVSQRSGLLGGVALLAFAGVVLAVALTRLYAALFGQHLALLGASTPLLGAGLGAVLLHAAPGLARPPALFSRLTTLAAATSGATVAALIALLHVRPGEDLTPRSSLLIGAACLASALPFIFSGIAVAAAIRHAARDVERLYLAQLGAAAGGAIAAIGAMRVGAPRAVLAVAIITALAGIPFWLASRDRDGAYASGQQRAPGALVSTFVLGTVVLLLGDFGAPWLKLPGVRWVPLDKVELQAWSEAALVTVERPRAGMAWVRLDGSAASSILDPKTTPPVHPDEMAYVLHRDRGPALVIGAGGGRDVRAALKAGQKEVHAVEGNQVVVDRLTRGRFAAFSGDLYSKPEVRVAVGDGRGYARRSPEPFRSIVLSLLDTSVAASAGALELTESRLYTVEAFHDLLERLTPEGTLLVTRWDGELDRLLALGAAGLRSIGAASPKDHLFACGAARSTALLLKRAPLTAGEVDALRRHCKKNKFTEAFAPDEPGTERRRQIVDAAAGGSPLDLVPPTDDRPFFYFTIPPRSLPAALRDVKGLKEDGVGVLVAAALLAGSAALLLAFLLAPILGRPASLLGAPDRGPRARALAFFLCAGAGFALLETALVQRAAALLGPPSAALSVALPVLLLSAGAGGVLTARTGVPVAARAVATRAQLLVVAAVAWAAALGPVLSWGFGLGLGGRLGLALAVLIPPGLLMGAIAPLGVRIVASRAPAILPWCWGLSALAGLVATAAGALLAPSFGYASLLLAGGLAYLLVALFTPPAAEGDELQGPVSARVVERRSSG